MLKDKFCEYCNTLFQTSLDKSRYCSNRCSNIAKGIKISEANQKSGNWLECSICKKEKPSGEFSFNIRNDFLSGRRNYCKRCGANEREHLRLEKTWKDDAVKILFNNSKQRSKNSGIEHTISKKDIVIPDFCPVFGSKLSREDKSTWKNAPSIDRIDNTQGYIKSNIVIVSRRANILKKDASIDEIIKLADFYKTLK
jgi:hypothetical protein